MSQVEIWIDGGIKRGSDVAKALALGAKGVGLGRAALYGLAVDGENGVHRSLQSMFPSHIFVGEVLIRDPVLADETITTMRLLGVSCVDELRPQHVSMSSIMLDSADILLQVNTAALNSQLYDGPSGIEEAESVFRARL